MGSDSNSYYTSQNISNQPIPASQYYQQQSDNDTTMSVKNMNSEWISGSDNADQLNHEQARNNNNNSSENKSKNYNQSQFQQWNFPGNSYRFYNENSHYGIILSSQSQASESTVPSSSSSSSGNSSLPHTFVESHPSHQLAHQMQTQHLKRAYYQGLEIIKFIRHNYRSLYFLTTPF
jgi:hypothetical protein